MGQRFLSEQRWQRVDVDAWRNYLVHVRQLCIISNILSVVLLRIFSISFYSLIPHVCIVYIPLFVYPSFQFSLHPMFPSSFFRSSFTALFTLFSFTFHICPFPLHTCFTHAHFRNFDIFEKFQPCPRATRGDLVYIFRVIFFFCTPFLLLYKIITL